MHHLCSFESSMIQNENIIVIQSGVLNVEITIWFKVFVFYRKNRNNINTKPLLRVFDSSNFLCEIKRLVSIAFDCDDFTLSINILKPIKHKPLFFESTFNFFYL